MNGSRRVFAPADCSGPCPPGGGTVVRHRDVQAAAGRGGRLGDDQRAVGSHHVRHAHLRAHRGGIRDSEEAEPAGRADRVQTLVKDRGGGPGLQDRDQICSSLLYVFSVDKRTMTSVFKVYLNKTGACPFLTVRSDYVESDTSASFIIDTTRSDLCSGTHPDTGTCFCPSVRDNIPAY